MMLSVLPCNEYLFLCAETEIDEVPVAASFLIYLVIYYAADAVKSAP